MPVRGNLKGSLRLVYAGLDLSPLGQRCCCATRHSGPWGVAAGGVQPGVGGIGLATGFASAFGQLIGSLMTWERQTTQSMESSEEELQLDRRNVATTELDVPGEAESSSTLGGPSFGRGGSAASVGSLGSQASDASGQMRI